MRFRTQSLASRLIVLTLLFLAGSAAAQGVSPGCEAAMDRAAGHYSQCLLRADAHYARHENATKLEKRQMRCETRFERRTSRAFSRYGADECTSAELVAALADRTVTYAEGVSIEAHGLPAYSILYVQNATGGTLSESILTLTGVSPQTGWFTDRPYRHAGQITTQDFVSQWDEGAASFAEDPPNADFTCTVDGEVVNYVVELTAPNYAEGDLSYAIDLLGDESLSGTLTCSGNVNLFVGTSLQVEASDTSSVSGDYDHIWYQICLMVGDEYCEKL